MGLLVDLGCRRLGAASSGSGRWGAELDTASILFVPGIIFYWISNATMLLFI